MRHKHKNKQNNIMVVKYYNAIKIIVQKRGGIINLAKSVNIFTYDDIWDEYQKLSISKVFMSGKDIKVKDDLSNSILSIEDLNLNSLVQLFNYITSKN